ncbi:hypothetical protein VB716_10405 [Synechococcus sp. CCY9201]|uniref:hypothetical protein n=1 Tax=unclassified Synechococcus TaxID=2626047 RepID=UPI002AD55897|nr:MULTISPECIES: hypothetical protein [unclassified Synechococcus]MEA5423667.1 hypothetical protein [Synechococcus sp. CCY9202]MEA5474630.1 hypothetical protein [Synechococcus sp. CCY9201]CAK6687837.1 hypothetical protein IFHNHDMJ_00282 [Synechococcus sp. CBW1107]
MTAGELFLESLSSGVITQAEIDWLVSQQGRFSRSEQAAMQRLGRLLDHGQIQLGCRIAPHWQGKRQVLREWFEPLGLRRRSSLLRTT